MTLVSALAGPKLRSGETGLGIRPRLRGREGIDAQRREYGHGEYDLIFPQYALDLLSSQGHVLLHVNKVSQVFSVGTS